MGKGQVFHNEYSTGVHTAIAVWSPMTLAFFVAVSRTVDYHHNFSDIIAGALLGTGMAFYFYYMYFPSHFHPKCHLPKLHPALARSKSDQFLPVVDGSRGGKVEDV
jgi:membrane-associated phospholipid phosphatase